jgi:aspartyl-tRNA(Asn)/glutamyl-tRNA(Gln) amidotransferase subunit B
LSDIKNLLKEAGYQATIGLEVHVQLNTESKLFSADANAITDDPNTHISPITMGHPGTLPMLNEAVLQKAIMMGLACECEITQVSHFARKNYFYPDLPKGYQITQDKTPICVGGRVALVAQGLSKEYARLHHIHLEEDAGKSIHDEGPDTLIDLNRAGTPLIEIVTEPDMEEAGEAAALLQEIRRLVRFLDISGGNMENGELRCDANISIKPIGSATLGNKVEIKNMNSINNVRKAIDFEIKRQLQMVQDNEEILVETRTFDAGNGRTYGMRFKETMNDYRYFPDPDLAPVEVSDAYLQEIRANLPLIPAQFRTRFREEYQLGDYDVALLTEEKETARYFVALCGCTENFKAAANWVNGPLKGLLNEQGVSIDNSGISAEKLAELIGLVDGNKVSFSIASQRILPRLAASAEGALAVARDLNLLMEGREDELSGLVQEVLLSLPDKVAAFKKGKKGLMGLFMGEVMKKSKGKADPRKLQELLQKALNEK